LLNLPSGAPESTPGPAVLATRVRPGSGVIPVAVASLVLIMFTIWSPPNVFRFILGIPFLVFSPGYVLLAALIPGKKGLPALERLILSLILSIAIVALIGLFVNYVWQVNLETVVYTVAAFVFVMSNIALYRINRRPWPERLGSGPPLTWPGIEKILGKNTRDKVVAVALAAVLLGSLWLLFSVLRSPRATDNFTQFYILGQPGELADYPGEFRVGQAGKLNAGIINNEHRETSYHVEVFLGGRKVGETAPVVLGDQQTWEGAVSFVPDQPGEDQRLELYLFQGDETGTRLAPLRLWVDIKDAGVP
jgi:uncharacterized membrane protein